MQTGNNFRFSFQAFLQHTKKSSSKTNTLDLGKNITQEKLFFISVGLVRNFTSAFNRFFLLISFQKLPISYRKNANSSQWKSTFGRQWVHVDRWTYNWASISHFWYLGRPWSVSVVCCPCLFFPWASKHVHPPYKKKYVCKKCFLSCIEHVRKLQLIMIALYQKYQSVRKWKLQHEDIKSVAQDDKPLN